MFEKTETRSFIGGKNANLMIKYLIKMTKKTSFLLDYSFHRPKAKMKELLLP